MHGSCSQIRLWIGARTVDEGKRQGLLEALKVIPVIGTGRTTDTDAVNPT